MKESGRRDFLKVALATGAGMMAGQLGGEKRASAQEREEGLSEAFLALFKELHFDLDTVPAECKVFKENVPKVLERLIVELIDLQKNYKDERGWYFAPRPEDHAQVWRTMQEIVGTNAPYSLENFYGSLLREIPDALSRHGVFVNFSFQPLQTEDGATLAILPEFQFFRINDVQNDTIILNGQSFDRQILAVSSLNVGGQEMNRDAVSRGSFTARGSIIVHEEAEERYKNFYDQDRQKYLAAPGRVGQEDRMWEQMCAHTGSEQSRWAAHAAKERFFNMLFEKRTEVDFRDTTIAHETGHLLYKRRPEYKAEFLQRYDDTKSSIEFPIEYSFIGRDEAYAGATDLLLAKDTIYALHDLFAMYSSKKEPNEIPHKLMGRYLRAAAVEEILHDPGHYGLQLRTDPRVSLENTILFQLADIALDAVNVERLGRKLYQRLQNKMDPLQRLFLADDQGDDYDPAIVKAVRVSPVSKDYGSCGETDGKATMLTSVVVAAGGLLNRFARRKQQVAAEERKNKKS